MNIFFLDHVESGHWVIARTADIGWSDSLDYVLQSNTINVGTRPINLADEERLADIADKEGNQFEVAQTKTYGIFSGPRDSIEAKDQSLPSMSGYNYQDTSNFLKICLVVIASLTLLSISLSLYLIVCKRLTVVPETTNA